MQKKENIKSLWVKISKGEKQKLPFIDLGNGHFQFTCTIRNRKNFTKGTIIIPDVYKTLVFINPYEEEEEEAFKRAKVIQPSPYQTFAFFKKEVNFFSVFDLFEYIKKMVAEHHGQVKISFDFTSKYFYIHLPPEHEHLIEKIKSMLFFDFEQIENYWEK